MSIRADPRCVFLAVDGKANVADVFREIQKAVDGPIAPYIKGVKFNDVLQLPDAGEKLVRDFVAGFPGFVPMVPFVDLKVVDVWDTASNYMKKYYPSFNELVVTFSVHCSTQVFNNLPQFFPGANVAIFCVGTDVTPEDCKAKYDMTPSECAQRWLGFVERKFQVLRDELEESEKSITQEHCAAHVISSFDMLGMFGESFPWAGPIVPGIRDHWMLTGNQKRTAHSRAAIEAGARYLVLGGQATRGNPDAGIDATESQRRTARQIRLGLGIASPDDAAEEARELAA